MGTYNREAIIEKPKCSDGHNGNRSKRAEKPEPIGDYINPQNRGNKVPKIHH